MDSSPGPVNDEVIADSEGEMDEEDHPGDRGMLSANMKDIANIVSQVSASTLPGQLRGNSSISAFTTGHSQLNQISEVENFLTASIADRAKTRQRNPKSSTKPNMMASSADRLEKRKINGNISSDIIELSSDGDDDELNLRPSKPKPKAKPKPKLKVKDKLGNMGIDKTLDVPGTTETNTDNPLHAVPDSRPRPRPRPLVKRSIPAQEIAGPPPPLPLDIPGLPSSPSASVSHGPDLPVATSPVRPDLHTSQLPPSDPPLPTLTTVHDENDLPPIETLPNHDFDGPLSSPSSLFSDLGGSAKKRKRSAFNLEIDELASDIDLGPRKGQKTGADTLYHHEDDVAPQVPPHLLPPPPTFFAGSSCSSIGGGDRRLSPHVPSELARDVVDLTMLPPTIQPIGATVSKKVIKKAKISRQKKDDPTRMDEDELDNDFDPAESTKKGKAKAKPKGKRGDDTKAKKSKGQAQVGDSIVYKPRAQKTKESGKGKATVGDKDTFKSREFIDDSGDDQDPIQLVPLSPVDPGKPMSSSSINRINKKRKSVIESEPEDHTDEGEKDQQAIGTSLKKVKGKQRKKNSGNVDGNVKQWDASISTSTPLKPVETTSNGRTSPVDLSSPSNKRMNKKRSIIESNLEDQDEGEKNQQTIRTSSKKHKQGKKSGNVEDQQLAPEEGVAKENVMKSIVKVSKTDEKTNNDSALFPSLHSRYEIAPRRSSLPMSELIRRSNSALGSPFSTPQPRTSSSSSAVRPIKSGTTTYSPYLKSSRSLLSRIAPLHPNRRSPPPPLPPPPPRKKTKKELEMEEKWEEEMVDSVGGISEWTCLTDDEKKELRRAKWAREMGDWDD